MDASNEATVDAAGMRAQNAGLVLNLIWREREISRAELARRTGLSPSTVSAIVTELSESGLVRTIGAGTSRGGRRPVLLGFCDDAFAIIGVEFGATHVSVVLTNLRCEVKVFRHALLKVRDEPEPALATVQKFIEECLKAERVPRRKLVGIGIAVPCPVRPDAPGELSPLILPAWRGIDVQKFFGDAFGVPVHLDNDANLGALSESWWGGGAEVSDLTYIKLGTGIGSGHIIRGELYRGAGGTAGEIGHIAIDPAGPRCICGLSGCLVTLIGSGALLERAKHVKRKGGPKLTSVSEVVKAARAGDADALALIDDVGKYLGIAVAGLLNLMNPAVVVLGGEITGVGELLLDPLRRAVRARALSTSVGETRLLTSQLGERGIAVGAATLVLEAALRGPTPFGVSPSLPAA